MTIKSWKYLQSPEEVKRFLALPSYKRDLIEIEITYLSTGNVESTQVAYHSVRTHQLFLLERKLIAQGADPDLLRDFGQLHYEEGSANGYQEADCDPSY